MKESLLFIALLVFGSTFGQTAVKVTPAPKMALEFALTPFGMDSPFEMGNLDSSGNGTLTEKMEFIQISESQRADYLLSIVELLSFCDEASVLFTGKENIEAFDLGPFFLMNNDEMSGVITLATSDELAKWVNDAGYVDAVTGSWFEMVYINENYAYEGECTQTTTLDTETIEADFSLNLNLKKGLNYIEFKIESIHETTSEELASFPKNISVTAHQSMPSHAKLIAHYYY